MSALEGRRRGNHERGPRRSEGIAVVPPAVRVAHEATPAASDQHEAHATVEAHPHVEVAHVVTAEATPHAVVHTPERIPASPAYSTPIVHNTSRVSGGGGETLLRGLAVGVVALVGGVVLVISAAVVAAAAAVALAVAAGLTGVSALAKKMWQKVWPPKKSEKKDDHGGAHGGHAKKIAQSGGHGGGHGGHH